MKILFLTRFGKLGASSRMRIFQYFPWFKFSSIDTVVSPLFDDSMLILKYRHGSYKLLDILWAYCRRFYVLISIRQFDLIWIEKEALPWFPAWLESWVLRHKPYVIDLDDAIFHNYDLHRFAWVRRFYGRRIDVLMAGASLVVGGNRYLADRAIAAGARRVKVIPTVVDLCRYVPRQDCSVATKPTIVWIGSPSSVQYLRELAEPLVMLAKRQSFTLRVIGGGTLNIPGVNVESFPWSEEAEAALIQTCDVGIMPLRDTPWEQGKCAYKLIQYMACGLPTVASPIGANCEVVIAGETGLFANSQQEWVETLEKLLSEAGLRQRFGQAGRARVEAEYSLQQIAPRLVSLFKEVVRKQCAD